EQYHSIFDRIVAKSSGLFSIMNAGSSFEGRPIRRIEVGGGRIHVLLWSQMHGDESTATMAIADIVSYIVSTEREQPTQDLLSSLTLHLLPLVNPDGASRIQRRTAQNIDMNRDALALVTPEARILKSVRDEVEPEFGFNLHDQELSTIGNSRELTAIALLAPAFDKEKSDNTVRRKAKQVAAVFVDSIRKFIPGRIACYDDTFEPRAFGDCMQKQGTSTVLVESGHVLGDPDKNIVRKLNFVGILASLHAIAKGEYLSTSGASYEQLPFNGKKAYDVVIRNVAIDHGAGKFTQVDLGISYQVDTHSESTPKLIDVGDLHTYIGLKEIEGRGRSIPASSLSLGNAFTWNKFFS
ncbi:MAG TPA: M14 family zinc carboxypeptidase, partial [Saprospiraceae bacterium]|nr:M14 family zinc carboxypeptidase [Saprospiraceae bacterium]